MNIKPKKSSWVTSVFDDDDEDVPAHWTTSTSAAERTSQGGLTSATKKRSSLKRSRESSRHVKVKQLERCTRDGSSLWSEERVPRDALAVHKKKVAEVEDWLMRALTGVTGHRMLLLTGPAGSGKTACMRALAQEMGLTVQEWINSTSSGSRDWGAAGRDGQQSWVPGDSVPEEGQVTKFREFITRVNKYGTVAATASCTPAAGTRNLLLVEDIPNAFYREPAQFHDVLRRYSLSGRTPAVFIVSDAPQQQHSAKHLLPQHLHHTLALTNIQFNPVAVTLVSKALSRVCTLHSAAAEAELLSAVATAAAGDVRTALNALQFSTHGTNAAERLFSSSSGRKKSSAASSSSKSSSKGGSRSSSSSRQELAAVGGKDASLLMFRALGKVLYCKRSDNPAPALPPHLQQELRSPALEDAESIVEKSCLLPVTFLSFLHQNYTHFVPSVEAAAASLTCLADADVIMAQWTERSVLSSYSTVGVRGLMHAVSNNTGPPEGGSSSKGRWLPLHGPAAREVLRLAEERATGIRQLYRQQDMHDLTTQLLPYAAKIQRNILTPSSQLLREVGVFSLGRRCVSTGDRLAAGDAADDDCSDGERQTAGAAATAPCAVQGSEEMLTCASTADQGEEFDIEEIDG